MSWFCQIPLSLGSSCYRPNSRVSLLLLTSFPLPNSATHFELLVLWCRNAVAKVKSGCGFPGQHSSAHLGRGRGGRAPRLQDNLSGGNPRLLFLIAVSPLRNSAFSHTLLPSFSQW